MNYSVTVIPIHTKPSAVAHKINRGARCEAEPTRDELLFRDAIARLLHNKMSASQQISPSNIGSRAWEMKRSHACNVPAPAHMATASASSARGFPCVQCTGRRRPDRQPARGGCVLALKSAGQAGVKTLNDISLQLIVGFNEELTGPRRMRICFAREKDLRS